MGDISSLRKNLFIKRSIFLHYFVETKMITKVLSSPTSAPLLVPSAQLFWGKHQVMKIFPTLLKNLERVKRASLLISIISLIIGTVAWFFLKLGSPFTFESKWAIHNPVQFCEQASVSHPRETHRASSIEETIIKAKKNLQKALCQHVQRASSTSRNAYIDWEEIFSSEALERARDPLLFSIEEASEKGRREEMEDASFHLDLPEAVIAGVFDGHGGKEVALKARQLVKKWFLGAWIGSGKNPRVAFERVLSAIHKEVIKTEELRYMGSTALICFIDKQNNLLFTATVGDSEATIYRRSGATIKAIPLSLLNDWKDPKEARRAAKALENEEIKTNWPKANARELRMPRPIWREGTLIYPSIYRENGVIKYRDAAFGSINLSRALGDFHYLGTREKPILLHKPKVTVCLIEQGDILLLACDGLRECGDREGECMQEEEIIREIELHEQELMQQEVENQEEDLYEGNVLPSLAQRLADCAIERNRSGDNVTTIVIKAI